MKFRNAILACLLASLAAVAGIVPASAGAQGGDAPAEVKKANRATFVLYRNAAGEVTCRVATAEEHRRIVNARGGDLHLIYKGAPRTRTPAGIVEEDTVSGYDSTGDSTSSTSAATSTGSLTALLPSAGLHIFLHGTTQLEQNQAAKNAFIVAANRWEALISNPINVVIDVDFGPTFFDVPYDDTNILGQTGSRQNVTTFSNLRQRLINNSPTLAELQLYNALPASAVPVELSGGSNSTLSNVVMTRANARAIGLATNIPNPDTASGDAQIGFNSNFNNGNGSFDFNPDDGISSGATDFDAVVTHEIGHALGFTSNSGGTTPTALSVWDVFRFRPGTASFGTLATAPRVMVKGGTQVYFNGQVSTVPATSGATELGLSTGGPDPDPDSPADGDHRQSSHWKDDQLVTGRPNIGIMDPTISPSVRRVITDNDVKAIDSFGYAIGGNIPPPSPPPSNDNFSNAAPLQGSSGSVSGTNVSATKESGEPNHGDTGGASVWYSWTAPATGTATFDTIGSNYDTTLAAYTGSAINALTKLDANDDITLGQFVQSRISFNAVAGTTYRIAVDGFEGETGTIVLNWQGATPPISSTIQFSSADYGIVESGVLATVTVIRTGDLTTSQNVTFITDTTGTATSGTDYNPVSQLVSFGPGETAKSINVGIIDDTQSEPTETVVLKLINPSSGVTLGPNATLSITDDDFAQFNNVQFASTGTTVAEAAGKFTVTVTRSGSDVTHAATVFYRTVNGSASDRTDYTAAAGTLRFGANETSKSFDVFITDDRFNEGAEQFNITLSDASQTTVGTPATFTVNVTDNDSANGPSPVRWDSNFEVPFFVRQHYVDFLNREADAAGLAFWSDQINSCGANQACIEARRINVSGAFFQAIEFQETGYLSYRTYKTAYGDAQGTFRDANNVQIPILVPVIRLEEFLADTRRLGEGVIVGQGAWQEQLDANKRAYFEEFASRQRFRNIAPPTMTPSEFANVLFTNAGLTPTLEQRQLVVGEFGGAQNTIDRAARGRALRRVAEDPALNQLERNRAFVTMQFFGYLRRDPNAAPDSDHTGWKFWLDKLNQANGNFVSAEMVKAFLTADEYRNRFGN